jgi:hypothetical protein
MHIPGRRPRCGRRVFVPEEVAQTRWCFNSMREFGFEPIKVNSSAPGGACALRTFDDIGAFILLNVDIPRSQSRHWQAVRQDSLQARFGARRAYSLPQN